MNEPVKDKTKFNIYVAIGVLLFFIAFTTDNDSVLGAVIVLLLVTLILIFFAWVEYETNYDQAQKNYKHQMSLLQKQQEKENEELRIAKWRDGLKKDSEVSLKLYLEEKKKFTSNLDQNQDGIVDLVACNIFSQLLKEKQSEIIAIDKTYIQKFVKISNFTLHKQQYIQRLFEQFEKLDAVSSKDFEFESSRDLHNNRLFDLNRLIEVEIYTYESVVFHSINMLTALFKNDLITFYEIFESFDKLGIFNTGWENELTLKLSSIENKLDKVIQSVKSVELVIAESLGTLNYINEKSYNELHNSVSKQLSEIGESINMNNLLTGIQVYQTHKLNKSIKRLN